MCEWMEENFDQASLPRVRSHTLRRAVTFMLQLDIHFPTCIHFLEDIFSTDISFLCQVWSSLPKWGDQDPKPVSSCSLKSLGWSRKAENVGEAGATASSRLRRPSWAALAGGEREEHQSARHGARGGSDRSLLFPFDKRGNSLRAAVRHRPHTPPVALRLGFGTMLSVPGTCSRPNTGASGRSLWETRL